MAKKKKGPMVFGGETAEVERCEFCGTPRAISADADRCATCGKRFPLMYSAPRAAAEGGDEDRQAPRATGARRWGPVGIVSLLAATLVGALVVVVGKFGGIGPLTSPEATETTGGWTFALREGDSLRYRIEMTAKATIDDSVRSMTEERHVLVLNVRSLDPAGTATVELRTEEPTVTENGRKRKLRPEVQEALVARDGRIAFQTPRPRAAVEEAVFLPGVAQFLPLLPEQAPAPGATWVKTFVIPAPVGNGSAEYTAVSRLARYEETGLAVIESDITIPFEFVLDEKQARRIFGKPTANGGSLGFAVEIGGRITVHQTSWYDPVRDLAVRGRARGEASVRVTFRGLPPDAPAPYSAPSAISTAYQLEFEQV